MRATLLLWIATLRPSATGTQTIAVLLTLIVTRHEAMIDHTHVFYLFSHQRSRIGTLAHLSYLSYVTVAAELDNKGFIDIL